MATLLRGTLIPDASLSLCRDTMGLILLGIFLIIVGIVANALDILPGGILRMVGWLLIIVGVLVALVDIARRPRARRA